MPAPAVYDHVSLAGTAHPPGTYRVVGVTGGTVTLLRVADADGHRVHGGETITVDRDAFDAFDPAANPDGDRSLGSVVEVGYWSLRAFARELRAHPLPTAAALSLVAVGVVGDALGRLPDPAFGALILAGSLALAYVGSGRL
ncbi:hypothetical protein [Haloplanus halophilus]|uniref:hypothetical protein n=1 Tax=Haloplanus halophilus TaxID=2949993 RepID=UPI00203CEDCE|nr:hypothetical protein [Haloplanus sp. GDY1]